MIRARHLPLVTLLLCAGPALAQQPPEVVPYQGYLTDANGSPVDGNVSMTIRMYDQSDANQSIWEETWNNVPVQDGAFVLYLGQYSPIVDAVLATDTRYLGIEIGSDGEAQPRQRVGSVPFALFAKDSYYLRGYGPDHFVSHEQLEEMNYVDADEVRVLIAEEGGGGEIDLDGYVTDEELAAALAGLGDTYLTVEDIDARNYIDEGDLENYVTNAVLDARLENYVSNAALDARLENYVTNAALDARLENYVTNNDLAAAIADFITEADLAAYLERNNYVQDADLDELRDRIGALETRVDNLDDALNARIDALEARLDAIAAAGQPYLLGRSAQTSNGRFSFGGFSGIQAANAMCVASFPNEPTAHFCSPDEVMRAMATSAYNRDNVNTFNNVATWTVAQASNGGRGNNGLFNTCQNLMYNSADNSNGTRLTVQTNYQSQGNGGGVTGAIAKLEQEVACGQNMPVLCCR